MLPPLSLVPGSAIEWVLSISLGLAALAFGGASYLARASDERSQRRLMLLLGVYLSGLASVALALHALLGARAFMLSPYAGFLAMSVLVAWAIVVPRLRSTGLPLTLVFYMIFGCLLLGVLGSRLANVLADWAVLHVGLDLVARVADRGSGLGVFGAFIVDSLFLVALFRFHRRYSLARSLDASVTAIGVNIAIGRLGCLSAGCCFGAMTSASPLSIPVHAFQPGSPVSVAYAGQHDAHIWATQPIEAVLVAIITGACEIVYRRRATLGLPDGSVFAFLGLAYGLARAFVELLRADSPRIVGGVMTLWQALGLALALGAGLWLHRALHARPRSATFATEKGV